MNLFPYSVIRPEQDELLKEIASALEKKRHLVVHAPTGLGKTVAALVPCLEFGLKKGLTVFFLTSRHTQHAIALETLRAIKDKYDVDFTVADLIGKKNMCLQDGVEALRPGEFHEYCRKLRDGDQCMFYTNAKSGGKNTPVADVLISQIKKRGLMDTAKIKSLCSDEKLCPYEVATSLAKESNVIIADYSYIFNQQVSVSLFRRMQKNLSNCIVIVDEAHNLPQRMIDWSTERLTTFILRRSIQECEKFEYADLAGKLKSLLDALNSMTNELKEKKERLVTRQEFIDIVKNIEDYEKFKAELEKAAEVIMEKQKQSLTSSVHEFLELWEGEDKGYARILSKEDNKMMLTYKCLDPGLIASDIIKGTYCTIAMSGTLTPTSLYHDLLGFDNAEQKSFKSPFPEENKLSLIIPKTTTKFTQRNEAQFKQIASVVSEVTNAVPGNCAVFFPSYYLRDEVFKHYSEQSNKSTFLEVPDMSKDDKTDMLNKFKGYATMGAVLLGAITGSFSEGIDLLGDLLKCVVIVGLPLQQPDLETQEAIKYYDTKFGKGWDYGYIFPAFNKILQGAGRCIRSETDRGVIVYLDERYSWPNYIRCFPDDLNLKIKKDYVEEIEKFFH